MKAMLQVEQLEKSYRTNKSIKKVLRQISFTMKQGECLGVMGESGAGKTTLINLIAGFEKPTAGMIHHSNGLKIQMVFQSPIDSFNPMYTLGNAIREAARSSKTSRSQCAAAAVSRLLECGLPAEYMSKYPRQVSTGECQRAAIARALAAKPELLLCDEITSALDMESQQKVIELLRYLNRERQLSILFISHDHKVVEKLCHRVLEIKDGQLVT